MLFIKEEWNIIKIIICLLFVYYKVLKKYKIICFLRFNYVSNYFNIDVWRLFQIISKIIFTIYAASKYMFLC